MHYYEQHWQEQNSCTGRSSRMNLHTKTNLFPPEPPPSLRDSPCTYLRKSDLAGTRIKTEKRELESSD